MSDTAMPFDSQQMPPRRVRFVSRVMAVVCAVIAIAGAPVVLFAIWQIAGDPDAWRSFLQDAVGSGIKVPEAAPLWSRAAAIAVIVGCVAVAGFGFWRLRDFFRCVCNGAALSYRAADGLIAFARIVTILALTKPLITSVLSVLITWSNPPGQRQLMLSFSSSDLVTLVVGILLFVIAWSLREGARIAREHAEIV